MHCTMHCQHLLAPRLCPEGGLCPERGGGRRREEEGGGGRRGAHEHCCTMHATHATHATIAQAMRTEMLGLVDGLSAYHLLRGATVEKATKTPSKNP